MLLKITEHCSMGCIHCISDCKPDNTHMTEETFKDVVEFLKKYHIAIHAIVVSGGEPTEHPKFVDYMKYLVKELSVFGISAPQIAVTTNGTWIVENFHQFKSLYDDLRKMYNKVPIVWQITNVKGLYPKEFKDSDFVVKKLEKMNSVFIERSLPAIYPQGRAKDNNLDWSSKAPKCFNCRSIAKSRQSFIETLLLLSANGKVCTPTIEFDGSIKLGESKLCPPVSNIWKSSKDIITDIINCNCKACNKPIEKYLKEMEEEKEGMGLIIELINTEEYSVLNVLEKVKRLKPVLRQMMAEPYKIDWKIVIDSLRKKSSRPDYNIFPDSLDGFSYADFIILYTKIEGAYENDTYFIKRTCRDCGATFHLYKSEVEFFNSKDLVLPKRCKSCRIKNKQ